MTLEELQALLQPSQADRDNALNMGLLQAGLGILAHNTNKSNPMPALGAGGLMGLQGYQQSMDRSQNDAMRRIQTMQLLNSLKKSEQEMADAEALRKFDFGKFYQTPQQQAIGAFGPTPQGAAAIQNMEPKLDQKGMIAAMMQSGSPALRQQALGMLTKEEAPITLAEGAKLITKTGKEIATNAKPQDVKNGYLLPDGKGGWRIDPTLFAAEKELKATAAPKVSVSPTVKVGNTFAENVAKQGADRLFGQVEAAASAPEMAGAANQILGALDSGKVLAGPGTKWSVAARQAFGGDQEKLTSTRQVIQGLAKLSLQGRQSLRGQGTITDSEQNMLAKATSGDIDNMSVDEIRLIATGAIKNANFVYSQGKKASASLGGMKEFGSILPAFDLPEMPTYSPKPSSSDEPPVGAVRRIR